MSRSDFNAPPFAELSQLLIKRGQADALRGIQRGIEKEGLRANLAGDIAQTAHPSCLGSPLTHPHITTDYSESLLELITQPHTQTQGALDELLNTHRWVYQCLKDEIIWPGSMPCRIQGEKSIPIAEYGSSNSGQMKHVYRRGLAWRYGRIMQSIAGIHYNFSLPQHWWESLYEASDKSLSLQDFISAGYISLIRNFRRHAWLLTYLFGASPALDNSFFNQKESHLQTLDTETSFLPHATCLRMTDLGYKSVAQQSIRICYNHLDSYISSLRNALQLDYPPYQEIGTKVDGEYRQLNNRLLQIENEFYSEVRPKRTPKNGEKPLEALDQHGIEYIEVRLLDINPFLPLGIDAGQCDFLDAFLLHCLLSPSPECGEAECTQITKNLYDTAQQGRNPELQLTVNGETAQLTSLAQQHLSNMQTTTELLDNIHGGDRFRTSLDQQTQKVKQTELLPSSQVLSAMQEQDKSYRELMIDLGLQHQTELKKALINGQADYFKKLSQQSIDRQKAIEAEDDMSFGEYLKSYFKNTH